MLSEGLGMITRRRKWLNFVAATTLVLVLNSGAVADVSGVYELQEKGELRRLSVNELKGIGSVQFILYVESGDFSGSIMGVAEMKGNTATYQTRGCSFTITFSDNKALIRNANSQCRDYLKQGVWLDGNYTKVP
jgi:hypothetical protein